MDGFKSEDFKLRNMKIIKKKDSMGEKMYFLFKPSLRILRVLGVVGVLGVLEARKGGGTQTQNPDLVELELNVPTV